jgi:hypothetical protein
MPSSAERALRYHRIDMQSTLIVLLKSPVPISDLVGREVLTCVLAVKPSDFERQLIETKERHSARACTILDPVVTV